MAICLNLTTYMMHVCCCHSLLVYGGAAFGSVSPIYFYSQTFTDQHEKKTDALTRRTEGAVNLCAASCHSGWGNKVIRRIYFQYFFGRILERVPSVGAVIRDDFFPYFIARLVDSQTRAWVIHPHTNTHLTLFVCYFQWLLPNVCHSSHSKRAKWKSNNPLDLEMRNARRFYWFRLHFNLWYFFSYPFSRKKSVRT